MEHFARCITHGETPLTSGESGLRVVRLLEAASQSLAQRGHPIGPVSPEGRLMIPLLDLEAQYRAVQEPLEEAVLAVLRSGAYVLGPPVAAFERDFAAHCGTAEAVSVSTAPPRSISG